MGKCKIVTLHDILDKQYELRSVQDINEEYRISCNFLQLHHIHHHILVEWLNVLKENSILKRPKCEQKWVKDIQAMALTDNELWSRICTNSVAVCTDTYVQTLQYNIIHIVIPCNKRLNTWKV